MRTRHRVGAIFLALCSFMCLPAASTAANRTPSVAVATPVTPLPNPAVLAKMNESQLKSAFLTCDARSSQDLLSTMEAARCAMLHRELVERIFHGDTNVFDLWLNIQKYPEQNDKLHLPTDAPSSEEAVRKSPRRHHSDNGASKKLVGNAST